MAYHIICSNSRRQESRQWHLSKRVVSFRKFTYFNALILFILLILYHTMKESINCLVFQVDLKPLHEFLEHQRPFLILPTINHYYTFTKWKNQVIKKGSAVEKKSSTVCKNILFFILFPLRCFMVFNAIVIVLFKCCNSTILNWTQHDYQPPEMERCTSEKKISSTKKIHMKKRTKVFYISLFFVFSFHRRDENSTRDWGKSKLYDYFDFVHHKL